MVVAEAHSNYGTWKGNIAGHVITRTMKEIKLVLGKDGKSSDHNVENFFLASSAPLYIGVIARPSSPLWVQLSASRSGVVEIDGTPMEFSIPYRIEVGENSIFFLKPEVRS